MALVHRLCAASPPAPGVDRPDPRPAGSGPDTRGSIRGGGEHRRAGPGRGGGGGRPVRRRVRPSRVGNGGDPLSPRLAAALGRFNEALVAAGEAPDTAEMGLILLGNRSSGLDFLGRPAEADRAVAESLVAAERVGNPVQLAAQRMQAAEVYFERGRWDDALAEMNAAAELPLSVDRRLSLRGMTTLIAVYRDDRAMAAEQLRDLEDLPLTTAQVRYYAERLRIAGALAVERDGLPAQALARLRAISDPDSPTVRRANPRAKPAVAARRGTRSWPWASFRWPKRPPRPASPPRTNSYGRAARTYTDLGGVWALMRADARLRRWAFVAVCAACAADPVPVGKRSPRLRSRSPSWWAPGSPIPISPRRCSCPVPTVQTHVSHILAKLGAHSRIDIARQAPGPPGNLAKS